MIRDIIAIVPAAGIGRRFDPHTRKTFVSLDNIPVLVHTLKRLQREKSITEIIPVLRQEDIESVFEMVGRYGLTKINKIAKGGKERQDSVYNALKLIVQDAGEGYENSLVLIHDGARPLIPEGTVERLIAEINNADGAAPGLTPKDTLKQVSDDIITATIDRDNIRAIQTPQVFSFKVLKKAYDTAYHDQFYSTDDAALIERIGGKVKIIPGSPYNIKITTPEDLGMIEYFLKKELISI